VLLEGKPGSYFVYFGPEGEAEVSPPLEVKSGLSWETRPRPPGRCQTLKEMQDLLERAPGHLRRGTEKNVFIGHNPTGHPRASSRRSEVS